jgi:hypothetical protein
MPVEAPVMTTERVVSLLESDTAVSRKQEEGR